MKNILIASMLMHMSTELYAQQRGYYWNGYEWEWRGGGRPSREYPPNPGDYYRSRRNDCLDQRCVDQFHQWGGYDKRICFDQWGYPAPCR